MNLTEAGRKELAVALLLWRDFKTDGKTDMDITRQMLVYAKHLGIEKELEEMSSQLPPVIIKLRYP